MMNEKSAKNLRDDFIANMPMPEILEKYKITKSYASKIIHNTKLKNWKYDYSKAKYNGLGN